MEDRRSLAELGEFVVRRVEDDVRRAQASGDHRALEHALATHDLVTRMQRDLEKRPWARAEVGNYLRRAAQIRADHPEFRSGWE